jgi:hypothetical protein
MKITKTQLKQIIKEALLEAEDPRLMQATRTAPVDPQVAALDTDPTRAAGAPAGGGEKKQLAIVARELEVLLGKIKKALGQ